MNVSGLLTSAGINIGLCTVLSSLYSVLRKQPGNVSVYFGQRLSQAQSKDCGPSFFERIIPSASWIIKAWGTTEGELLLIGGLDAVVFCRIVIFSIRIFSVASIICISAVLPLNYFGHAMHHKRIRSESLEVFTIGNVKDESRWFWVHCLALYIISFCACALLYIEGKTIAKLRLAFITGSPQKLSRFTVLVRAIPWSGESYSASVTKFFSKYYATSYLSHQMVYYSGTVRKLVNDAEKMYNMLKSPDFSVPCESDTVRCGLCGVTEKSFKILSKESQIAEGRPVLSEALKGEKECAAALVFFRTRYGALVAAETLQSPNPMRWITDLAPEPPDVYWSNLWIPYRLLWVRRIGTILAAIVFMIFFLVPVSFVQGLVHLDKLKKRFSFVRKLSSERNIFFDMITGYLPSAMLMLFLCIAPPIMMAFSAIEGPIARSLRKKSACLKVLYFLIWNVFFANILSGTVMDRFDRFTSLKDIPSELANGVPSMAVFFMTYVLTSGWTSLAFELMQPIALLCYWLDKCFFRGRGVLCCLPQTFPYHTELPRLLLFGLLGFTSSITAPLILPFLMVYFFLAYLVYRNQFINVYVTKYDTGGLYWPIAHNAIIFSMTLMQVIALGVFGAKKSTVASSFTIPLIICTQIFNLYCRKRFFPIFKNVPAQVIMEMDRQDEHSGKLAEYHDQLISAYCQFKPISQESSISAQPDKCETTGRQLEEANDHLRSGCCSFKSSAHNSPLAGHLDQHENGIELKRQDSEDMKPVKRSNRSPKGQHPHGEIEELKPDIP